jgi:hypothetical protein
VALLQGYPCIPVRRFSSWFHPIWILDGGVARRSTTTEVAEAFPVDFPSHWGTETNHGWLGTTTYALDARVERVGSPPYNGVGQSWRSLQAGNIGHDPVSSPSWWEPVDDGLGADDASWITSPGLLRPDRGVELTGTVSIHIYARAAGISGAYWNQPITTGYQWSMVSGGSHWATVRQSGSADTCYYGALEIDDSEPPAYANAFLWKCVNGAVSALGSGSMEISDLGTQTFVVYAYGTTIGVAYGLSATPDTVTGWPPPGWNIYQNAQQIVLEVSDSTISAQAGPYVGLRAPASASLTSHEWYGGELGVLTVGSEVISPSEIKLSGSRPSATVTVTERP